MVMNRIKSPYATVVLGLDSSNVIVPQLLWFQEGREPIPFGFRRRIFINIGMWLERFTIIVSASTAHFSSVLLGHVHADDLGLDDVYRTIGLFLSLLLSSSDFSHDFDF